MTRDRYLGVDDPRDPAPPEGQPSPGGTRGTAAPVSGLGESETPAAAAESETDRCVRTVREVLLGQPGPYSLEAAALEIGRRLKGR